MERRSCGKSLMNPLNIKIRFRQQNVNSRKYFAIMPVFVMGIVIASGLLTPNVLIGKVPLTSKVTTLKPRLSSEASPNNRDRTDNFIRENIRPGSEAEAYFVLAKFLTKPYTILGANKGRAIRGTLPKTIGQIWNTKNPVINSVKEDCLKLFSIELAAKLISKHGRFTKDDLVDITKNAVFEGLKNIDSDKMLEKMSDEFVAGIAKEVAKHVLAAIALNQLESLRETLRRQVWKKLIDAGLPKQFASNNKNHIPNVDLQIVYLKRSRTSRSFSYRMLAVNRSSSNIENCTLSLNLTQSNGKNQRCNYFISDWKPGKFLALDTGRKWSGSGLKNTTLTKFSLFSSNAASVEELIDFTKRVNPVVTYQLNLLNEDYRDGKRAKAQRDAIKLMKKHPTTSLEWTAIAKFANKELPVPFNTTPGKDTVLKGEYLHFDGLEAKMTLRITEREGNRLEGIVSFSSSEKGSAKVRGWILDREIEFQTYEVISGPVFEGIEFSGVFDGKFMSGSWIHREGEKIGQFDLVDSKSKIKPAQGLVAGSIWRGFGNTGKGKPTPLEYWIFKNDKNGFEGLSHYPEKHGMLKIVGKKKSMNIRISSHEALQANQSLPVFVTGKMKHSTIIAEWNNGVEKGKIRITLVRKMSADELLKNMDKYKKPDRSARSANRRVQFVGIWDVYFANGKKEMTAVLAPDGSTKYYQRKKARSGSFSVEPDGSLYIGSGTGKIKWKNKKQFKFIDAANGQIRIWKRSKKDKTRR